MNIFEKIAQTISLLKLSDYIDILIVAVLAYELIKFMRKSNSRRLLKGLLVLFVALQLSGVLQLHMIYYFLSNAMQVGILALIILFQPELRKVLEKFGGTSIRGKLHHGMQDHQVMNMAILQTIEAVSDLSWSKTGALIIFEKYDSLDPIISTGTTINADVNAELLKNLFFNKAPLHDGAVVLTNGRITAAGCILPLSANQNISKELGTRHRAGVGMSEATDAVVIVVSEETGTISVAIGGMLKRHLAARTLEQLLKKELMTEEERDEKNGIMDFVDRILDRAKEGNKK